MTEVAHISARNRARLMLAIAVAVIAASVWGVAALQRRTADRVFEQTRSAQQMLTSMLDQQTGLRGFALTRRDNFLDPFRAGTVRFAESVRESRRLAHDAQARREVDEQAAVARRWRRLAEQEIVVLRARPKRPFEARLAITRKRVFDRFRAVNAEFQQDLAVERRRQLARAGTASVAVILLLSGLFGGLGYLVIERQSRRARGLRLREGVYRQSQAEFSESIQVMRNEREAHALIERHLERQIPGSRTTVLVRKSSDDRLEAAGPVQEGSALAAGLIDAAPEDCLAVRLAHPYEQGRGSVPLLTCELCGKSAAEITCVPSLVSGEVIGSVLIQREDPLEPHQRQRVVESIAQASPVLANLRNLAVAETRASTDALTGLPNSRSCRDNLKRMVAHAGRALSPMTAVILDLDHFKQINDRFGHGAGDDALAGVGDVLRTVLRASDFCGRYGGEEFLILLPDTDHEGGLLAAEKVREAVEALDVAQVDGPITASLGVATYPADATDAGTLVRMADRALYAAKGAGRNRVMLAVPDGDAVAD